MAVVKTVQIEAMATSAETHLLDPAAEALVDEVGGMEDLTWDRAEVRLVLCQGVDRAALGLHLAVCRLRQV